MNRTWLLHDVGPRGFVGAAEETIYVGAAETFRLFDGRDVGSFENESSINGAILSE
jgi:hypothetical protein